MRYTARTSRNDSEVSMGIFAYTLMTYGITIVISLVVVGIIVLVDKAVSAMERKESRDD